MRDVVVAARGPQDACMRALVRRMAPRAPPLDARWVAPALAAVGPVANAPDSPAHVDAACVLLGVLTKVQRARA
jgi:hypothetical protein